MSISSSGDHERLELSAVMTRTLGGNPIAILPDDCLAGMLCPLQAEVRSAERRAIVWAYRAGSLTLPRNEPVSVPADHIGLSNRSFHLLGLAAAGQTKICLMKPCYIQATVLTSNADDIPAGLSVHVPPSIAHQLCGERTRQSWVLASYGGQAVPLRVVVRRTLRPGTLHMSMLVRLLLGIHSGEVLQLAAFPDSVPGRRVSTFRTRLAALSVGYRGSWPCTAWGAVRLLFRLADAALELFLRLIFRAPEIVIRTIQAQTGDDDSRLVRLHPSVFAALGVQPGSQVIIRWGAQQTIAIALDDYQSPAAGPDPLLSKGQMVELTGTWSDIAFPDHLVGRLSSQIRHDLHAPALTVIIVRRRLRTLVLTHINQLVIPVGGLLVAAAALPGLRGWLPLAAGAIAVTVLALGNLRIPQPRKGQWP